MNLDPSAFHIQRIIIHGTLPCAFNVSFGICSKQRKIRDQSKW